MSTEQPTGLIPVEQINALELFSEKNLDSLLARIREETATFVPDLSTATSRKEIASLAYKVARSKTTIDDAGKALVADWKKKSAEVDAARKKARDYLDALRDEVRKPLDDWEAEQERIAREKLEAAERERQAIAEAARIEIERREAEIAAREAAVAALEREVAEQAARAKAEQERTEREERIRAEAAERAKREAAEAIARAEREKVEAERRAETERLAAIERARQAEIEAERRQAEAVRQAEQRAADEAARLERERAAELARVKAENERLAADAQHHRTINNEAKQGFIDLGVPEEMALDIVIAIASGEIPHVKLHYGA